MGLRRQLGSVWTHVDVGDGTTLGCMGTRGISVLILEHGLVRHRMVFRLARTGVHI